MVNTIHWRIKFPDIKLVSPVIREDGVLQHNLLKQLNELVGEVGGHEGLHRHGDVLRVLCLRQGRLYHLVEEQREGNTILTLEEIQFSRGINSHKLYLIDEGPPVLVLLAQHLGPQLHVPPLDQVPGLRLEQRVLVTHGDQLPVAVPPLVGLD